MMTFAKIATTLGTLTLLATPLAAQDAAVKARQGQMQLLAFNLGILGAMAKGNMEYDATAAGAAASNLQALSKLNSMALWPAGTDEMSIENTRALPALWENGADVMAKLGDLQAAADGMATASGQGLEAVQAAMGDLGKACGSCHKAYRAPDK